jgi:hypothetical protein
LADKASAEVKTADIFNPVEIPLYNVPVQTIGFVHLLFKFFRNRITGRVECQNLGLNEVRRHTAEQCVQNEGNTKQN